MRKPKGFSEDKQPPLAASAELQSVPYARLKIDSAGRIVIPAEMRAAMMVKPGDTITASVENGVFRITSPEVALARVRAFAEEFKARHPSVSVVDELIADRREEARRETERFERLEREAAEVEAARRKKR